MRRSPPRSLLPGCILTARGGITGYLQRRSKYSGVKGAAIMCHRDVKNRQAEMSAYCFTANWFFCALQEYQTTKKNTIFRYIWADEQS